MNCIVDAWHGYEAEIRGYLTRQVGDARVAEDLLQDTFLKAIEQGARFCHLENPRAWLFRVARNRLIDLHRRNRPHIGIDADIAEEIEEIPAIETLTACLPRALRELDEKERKAITLCDLQGLTQSEYAAREGLSLPGAKSRVQRARKQLKQKLRDNCQIRFDDSGQVCCYTPRNDS